MVFWMGRDSDESDSSLSHSALAVTGVDVQRGVCKMVAVVTAVECNLNQLAGLHVHTDGKIGWGTWVGVGGREGEGRK